MCGAGGLSRAINRGAHAYEAEATFSIAPRMTRFETSALFGRKEDRLHIAAGESLCSDWALFLKFASTALLIHALQNDRRASGKRWQRLRAQQVLRQELPSKGLNVWARDPYGKVAGRTSIDVQIGLWEYVGALIDEPWMPKWAPRAHRLWRRGISHASSPQAAATRLDWALKKAIYPKGASTAELRHVDAKFAIIGRSGGVFQSLKRKGLLQTGVVSDAAIRAAIKHAPTDTRAHARGSIIKQYCSNVVRRGSNNRISGVDWGWVSVEDESGWDETHFKLSNVLSPIAIEEREA